MDSRRKFLGKVASGLAGTLAAVPARALGASDRIRVGIIGVGDRGLELLNQIRVCDNAEVVAFADVYNKRLEKAASFAPNAATFADYRRLLDDSSIDAVVIATPPHLHAEQFSAALDAGKHVYQEKTLANTLDQAKRMRASYLKDRGKARGTGRPSGVFVRTPRRRRAVPDARRSHRQDQRAGDAQLSQYAARQSRSGRGPRCSPPM